MFRKFKRFFAITKIFASRFLVLKHHIQMRQVSINDLQLLVFANEDVGRELVFGGFYESAETEALRKLISPSDICIDVGANIGYYTTLLSSLASHGQVHAFEPVPINFYLLNFNIELNQLKNVIPNLGALGENTGKISFSVSRDGAYSSINATGRAVEACLIETEVQTIDKYLATRELIRVDFIKVDVEGAEGLVVAGAKNLLADPSRRPRCVMLELFDTNLFNYGLTVIELISRMDAFGYVPRVPMRDGRLVPFEPVHVNCLCNVFFIQTDRLQS
jgi:FkbM family methyltransferase